MDDFTLLLQPDIQHYILEKTGNDIVKLAFQKNPFPNIDFKEVLNQVEMRTKSKIKLPTWYGAKNIIYPSKVSLEQTSSETTAAYKAGLVGGDLMIDLTGGFGVDDYYFSKKVKQLIHCEFNPGLSEMVAHNFRQLNVENILCIAGDSQHTLENSNRKFDWIYIDPSRRNEAKGKVFQLVDCLPDVPGSLDFYFAHADRILIKTAPLLDITAGLGELHSVKNIHIVAVDNEVKELLWELEKGYSGNVNIKTVNIAKGKKEVFDFDPASVMVPDYGLPQKYLYEPNSAIMKSGGFSAIGQVYGLQKLHPHSHLYTAEELIDFPGRAFQLTGCFDYNAQQMKAYLKDTKANLTTRNFPETVENLRKKWKIKDGGNVYAFFTTDKNDNKIVLLCAKLN